MQYNLTNDYDKQKFKVAVNKYYEKQAIVELKIVYRKRTNEQNSYVHVLFGLYAINFGYTLEEAKHLIKTKCHLLHYEKKGETFIRSTASLDVLEMTNFIEWFRNHSSQEGLYLPTPEEYRTNQLYIDEQIRSCNEYL